MFKLLFADRLITSGLIESGTPNKMDFCNDVYFLVNERDLPSVGVVILS